MARYRKIDVRIWGDEKFMALSPLQPSGQALWFYLLTNPNTNSIPGLFRAGEAQLAEELGWPLKGFREAFHELFTKGLAKADWKARLVWIPRAVKYNRPESPNVIIGWSVSWDELPECSLKAESYQALRDFTEGLPEAFSKAFTKACPKPMANQEQEQEQEQEPEQEPEQKSLLAPASPSPSRAEEEFSEFWSVCERTDDKKGALKAWLSAKKSKRLPDLATVKLAYCALAASWDWTKEDRQYHPKISTWLNREGWLEKPRSGGPPQTGLKMIFPVKNHRTPEEEARLNEGAEMPED